MTTNQYIIDTSSLIELARNNPSDVFPTLWQKIEVLIRRGALTAPREVFYEVRERDDPLARWARRQTDLFQDPTQKQLEILKDVLAKYPSLVKEDRKQDADSWVVALALENSTGQIKLTSLERIVVTEERIRGDRVTIPFVCQKYNIETTDLLGMFRLEEWKF